MSTKKCYKCKIHKIYDDFYKDCYSSNGLSSKCKTCAAKTFKEYWELNKEQHKKVCNMLITCSECLGTYHKSGKTCHYRTKKHIKNIKNVENEITLENRIL